MHTGKNYSFFEVLHWTRRDIIALCFISAIPTSCYILLGWQWLAIPWLPVALLGTAVAFVVGFKNNASYDRMWDARKAWGSIVNSSRSWGIMVKNYISNKHAHQAITPTELLAEQKQLINRHVAWLTALRYQLREPRAWEAIYKKHNAEYKDKWFEVEEHKTKIEDALKPLLSAEEYETVIGKSNRAAQIISLQSDHLQQLLHKGLIEDFRHMELSKMLVEFYTQQGICERIKNFPYPRQFATLNLWFIKIFIVLIPLGMLQEFEKLGGNLIWLSIPFSALAGWIFTTLEKIGESTESPFEGSANDVPITSISRTIEIDLKEMFNYENIPTTIKPNNNIVT